MRTPRKYEQWQKDFIAQNASKLTYTQLSEKVKIPVPTLQKYCKENKLVVRYAHNQKENKLNTTVNSFKRPPAVYNQSPSPFGIADWLHRGLY